MQWWNMFRSLTNSFYRHPGLPVNTSRLLLRDFVAADHASVHRNAVDPKVTQYTERGPNREADTKVFLAHALAAQRRRPRKQFDLAVVLKQDGYLLGACGLHVTQPPRNEGYLGYWLGRPFWGNGYATETVKGRIAVESCAGVAAAGVWTATADVIAAARNITDPNATVVFM